MIREGFDLESTLLLSSNELIAQTSGKISWHDLHQLRGIVSNRRLPDFNAPSILEVDFVELANNGLTNVLVDLDLTIRRAGDSSIGQEIVDHLQEGRHEGAIESLSIVSDSKSNLGGFASQIGADGIFQPYKTPRGWKATKGSLLLLARFAKKKKGLSVSSTVNIGDRYENDVNLPKRGAGIRSVLVDRLGPDYWFDSFKSWRRIDQGSLNFARHNWCKFLGVLGVERPEGLQDLS